MNILREEHAIPSVKARMVFYFRDAGTYQVREGQIGTDESKLGNRHVCKPH